MTNIKGRTQIQGTHRYRWLKYINPKQVFPLIIFHSKSSSLTKLNYYHQFLKATGFLLDITLSLKNLPENVRTN